MHGLFFTLALAVTIAPALAQAEPLPSQSRSERQVDDINRSLTVQQQNLRQNQQTQFEINQLRQSHSREQVFSPPIGSFCGAGQVGC